jgi:hypothetical protein
MRIKKMAKIDASQCLRHYTAERFNQLYPVGSAFVYFSTMHVSDGVEVVTLSEAWELGLGDAVVRVSGVSGGVAISHLAPDPQRATSLENITYLESIRRAWPEHSLVHQLVARLIYAINLVENLKTTHLRELNAYETTVQNLNARIEALAAKNTEAEAQGVEKFAHETIAIGREENDDDIVYAGKQALLFARKLRSGEGGQL